MIDPDPYLPRHVEPAAVDRWLELSGFANGGIAAAVAVAKDELTLRRVSPAFSQGGMPARNPGMHGLDA